jgi:Protein of unknown function (DUF3866)
MLKLRRAIVVEAGPCDGPEQQLTIELLDASGARGDSRAPVPPLRDPLPRAALADIALVGGARPGDEVVVNVQARDLGLGSGGFDIVHVNLSRGLRSDRLTVGPSGGGARSASTDASTSPRTGAGASAMKLNYTSLQHIVQPVEERELDLPLRRPVSVLALHGQLAPLAWAFTQGAPGARLGYVQTEGGALPGGHSRTVRALRERDLLAGHLTAGAAFGGEGEAITTAGALHHGLRGRGWDAAVCGPGPGIVGSGSPLGHGGMAALDSAHTALALGCSTLLVARMSSGDPRARHRPISHHTLTVLDLLLEPVTVALPAGLEIERPARIARHDWRAVPVDLPAYAASDLPAETMGRDLTEDPLFFGAALAAGTVLAELLVGPGSRRAGPRGEEAKLGV